MISEAAELFGSPRGFSGLDAWSGIEGDIGPLPDDYKEFCSLYGAGVVGEFLKILHPDSTEANQNAAIQEMAPLYQELYPDTIPHPVFPEGPGGMVLWALSAESDAFFLIPGEANEWRIGVWFRQWAEWEEFETPFIEWIVKQVRAELIIPGLPLRVHGGFRPLG